MKNWEDHFTATLCQALAQIFQLKVKKQTRTENKGKTKHFQTLYCGDDRDIMLCDCPGLVFPSQVTVKEELVLAGILPFNHIRDYMSPVELMTQLIPRHKVSYIS